MRVAIGGICHEINHIILPSWKLRWISYGNPTLWHGNLPVILPLIQLLEWDLPWNKPSNARLGSFHDGKSWGFNQFNQAPMGPIVPRQFSTCTTPWFKAWPPKKTTENGGIEAILYISSRYRMIYIYAGVVLKTVLLKFSKMVCWNCPLKV